MALHIVDGLMGSGKSYYVVNGILLDALVESRRPVAVTDNLEIKFDNLVLACARRTSRSILRSPEKLAAFRESIMSRITVLTPEERPVTCQTTGRPLLVRGSGASREFRVAREDESPFDLGWDQHRAHVMGEFWYFTRPNSVIIYDEAGDRMNARKWQESLTTKLQSYINHSRHYRDDLYFIAQSVEDLDKQLREKFHYIHNVRNSLKSPICESKSGLWHFIFGGMRWPVQFFIVDQCVREGRKLSPFLTRHIWPKKEGFGLYESFSKPSELEGKAVGEDGESEDIGMPWHKRLRPWIERIPSIMALGGVASFVGVLLYGAFTGELGRWVEQGLTTAVSSSMPSDPATQGEESPQSPSPAPAPSSPTSSASTAPAPPVEFVGPPAPPELPPPPPPERILAVTNEYVLTEKTVYSLDLVPDRLRVPLRDFLGVFGRELFSKVRFAPGE